MASSSVRRYTPAPANLTKPVPNSAAKYRMSNTDMRRQAWSSPANSNSPGRIIATTAGFLFRRSVVWRAIQISWSVYQHYRHLFPEFEAFWMAGPWSIQKTCPNPRGGYGLFQNVAAGPFPGMCTTSTGTGAFKGYPSPVPNSVRGVQVLSRYEPSGALRGDVAFYLSRPSTGAVLLPRWGIERLPLGVIDNPHAKKPFAPARNPARLPVAIAAGRKPDPYSPPAPPDVKQPAPPARDRETVYNPGVGPGSAPITVSRPAIRRPPPAGTREKKFEGSGQGIQRFFRRISRAKEAATELDDFIDSIFDALPKAIQNKLKGRKTPQSKLKQIWDNWDKIDWDEAVKNIIVNHVEDKVVGRALAAGDKAAKKRGATNTTASRAWIRAGRVF